MAIAWPVSAIASIIWLFGLQAILLGRQVNCAVELNPTILLSGLFDLEYYQSSPPYTSRCTDMVNRALARAGGTKLAYVPTVYWVSSRADKMDVIGYCMMDGTNGSPKCLPITQDLVKFFRESMKLCMQLATQTGINEIYIIPHLDEASRLSSAWRNALVFNPATKYGGWTYEEALLNPIADAVGAAAKPWTKVHFALQGEMSACVTSHPRDWTALIGRVRQRVVAAAAAAGTTLPSSQVEIGLSWNFNKVDLGGAQLPSSWENVFASSGPDADADDDADSSSDNSAAYNSSRTSTGVSDGSSPTGTNSASVTAAAIDSSTAGGVLTSPGKKHLLQAPSDDSSSSSSSSPSTTPGGDSSPSSSGGSSIINAPDNNPPDSYAPDTADAAIAAAEDDSSSGDDDSASSSGSSTTTSDDAGDTSTVSGRRRRQMLQSQQVTQPHKPGGKHLHSKKHHKQNKSVKKSDVQQATRQPGLNAAGAGARRRQLAQRPVQGVGVPGPTRQPALPLARVPPRVYQPPVVVPSRVYQPPVAVQNKQPPQQDGNLQKGSRGSKNGSRGLKQLAGPLVTAPLKFVAMQADQFTHRVADTVHHVNDAVQHPGPILGPVVPLGVGPGALLGPGPLLPGRRALKQLLGGFLSRFLNPRSGSSPASSSPSSSPSSAPASQASSGGPLQQVARSLVLDVDGLRALVSACNFHGISAYAPVSQNFAPTELQNAAFTFFASFQSATGIDLASIMKARGQSLHYSEFGVGGGTTMDGTSPAVNAAQVALYPYYGTFPKKYDPSLDPWRNPDARNFMDTFYTKTLTWLSQGGGPSYPISSCFIWSLGSYDVLAIYTESTSKAGSFLQTDVAAAIKAHNNAVAGNSG